MARFKSGAVPLPLVAVVGAALGLGIGLPGFFYLESPLWVLPWAALFGLLGWLGFTAAPAFDEQNPVPRKVQDGPLTMIKLPGGYFWMGSPDSDELARANEKPRHRVTVAGFRMATTPVTAGLYREIMGGEKPPEAQARLPVVNINWYDAIAFCNKLSRRQGYRPCYRSLFGRWWCNWGADGYRLPTEAEWEYACCAETNTRYCFGNNPAGLGAYAWFSENAKGLRPVSTKRPNRWGLYDMHGNVWEWCWDRYGPYSEQAVKNPRGPWKPKSEGLWGWRVLRGGSFSYPPEFLRSASRDGADPVSWNFFNGFRCVRVPPQLID